MEREKAAAFRLLRRFPTKETQMTTAHGPSGHQNACFCLCLLVEECAGLLWARQPLGLGALPTWKCPGTHFRILSVSRAYTPANCVPCAALGHGLPCGLPVLPGPRDQGWTH